MEGLRSEWHRIGPKVPRIGNENFPSGFCLPLEISSFQWQRNGPALAQWHSIDRLPLHPMPFFWANPAPLRNCPYNIKSQQWQAGSPKKLSTLPWWKEDDIDWSVNETNRIMNEQGRTGKCYFCDFSCEPNLNSEPSPWYNLPLHDHQEEVHPETEEWFA